MEEFGAPVKSMGYCPCAAEIEGALKSMAYGSSAMVVPGAPTPERAD